MSTKKTPIYFWLRLDNNFYKNLAIKKARKMAGGDTMIVIYQKMMLGSLETNGTLYYEGTFDNLEEELALMLDETNEQVAMTLAYFIKAGLIQIDENQDIEMLQVPALIQQETNWARYKRDQRNGKKLDNVQQLSSTSPTELEIELKKEIETDIYLESEKNPAHAMMAYFNQRMNRNIKNTGTFSNLVLKNVSLQEFKDVVNYVASWSEDILQNVTANTIARKFDSYSDKAAELGFRNGKEPVRKSGKTEKIVPKFVKQEQHLGSHAIKKSATGSDVEAALAKLKGIKTSSK